MMQPRPKDDRRRKQPGPQSLGAKSRAALLLAQYVPRVGARG